MQNMFIHSLAFNLEMLSLSIHLTCFLFSNDLYLADEDWK